MKLTGIEIRNFRSIGEPGAVLNPWKRCSILVGQNNSGKSSLLEAIRKITESLNAQHRTQIAFLERDAHRRLTDRPLSFRMYFQPSKEGEAEWLKLCSTDSFWFDFTWRVGQPSPSITDHVFANIVDVNASVVVLNKITGRSWQRVPGSERVKQHYIELGQEFFNHFVHAIPRTYVIPEFRQIRSSGDAYNLNGENLVAQLAYYQHPDDGQDHLKGRFRLIESFVRELLHLPTAELEVTHDKNIIMLTSDGLRLPLFSYGTGVHELVILVTGVLSVEDSICCIEEPEIHMHPRLQREFIDFIVQNTTNQYLISTHSPTFINAFSSRDDFQIFHLRNENNSIIGGPIQTDSASINALADLGVKASDLLQANCIVWVEGPSDRVYVKCWLNLVSPGLREGRDYSIMFYGGRLLSHLHLGRDQGLNDLIHVLRLNQHAVVIMDSDRTRESDDINDTKKRGKAECESNGGICWVTDGREIENELSQRTVVAACEDIAGKHVPFSTKRLKKFDDALKKACKVAGVKEIDYTSNKYEYARKLCDHILLADMSDSLKGCISQIAAQIREWSS